MRLLSQVLMTKHPSPAKVGMVHCTFPTTASPNGLGKRLAIVLLSRRDHEVGAGGGERAGKALAQPSAGACYQGDFAGEIEECLGLGHEAAPRQ